MTRWRRMVLSPATAAVVDVGALTTTASAQPIGSSIRWSTPPATTSGPTATGPITALTTRWSGSRPCAGSSSHTPERPLGQHSVKVRTQADRGFVENVSYRRADVGFAALHIVGSNNSLLPWTGHTAPAPEQLAEVQQRTAATLCLIDQIFDQATKDKQRAVVLLTQADMFDPTVPNPPFADHSGFQPIVREIAKRSAAFGKPVYLFNGIVTSSIPTLRWRPARPG